MRDPLNKKCEYVGCDKLAVYKYGFRNKEGSVYRCKSHIYVKPFKSATTKF